MISILNNSGKHKIHYNIIGALFGNVVEFYDFMIFSFSAGYIAKHFFNVQDVGTSLLFTYCVQGTGYLSRPIGALLFGHIGDRVGRQKSLLCSILIIGIATFLIGILPGYKNIGAFSLIILLFLRIVQGMAVSGEEGSAATYLTEVFSNHRKGVIGSLVLSSVFLGVLLGGTVCFVLEKIIATHSMQEWGWRIPFFLSLPLCLITFFLRKNSPESNDFIKLKQTTAILKLPSKVLFRSYYMEILALILLLSSFSILTSFYIVVLPGNFGAYLELSRSSMLLMVVTGLIFISILTPCYGLIADRIGYKTAMMVGLFISLPGSLVGMASLLHGSILSIFLANLIFVAIISMVSAPVFAILTSTFPAEVRCSGVSFVINTTVAVCAGIFPAIATFIIQKYDNYFMIAWLLIIFILVSLFGMVILYKKHNHGDLQVYASI